jgi:membrane protease YdiL (CAAX protease family)
MMPYHRSVHGPPQPGWYPDPWAQSWYRWWNGERWTPSVHPEQVYVVEPRPPHVTHSFSPVASIAVLAATFVAILLTRTVVDNIGIDADWIVILIAYTVLFGLMTSSAVLLSRTLGSGSLRRDFGFAIKVDDIGWGALVIAGAMVARIVLLIFLSTTEQDPVREPGRALDSEHGLAFAAFALAALVGAPLIEELVFRGVLQRGLTKLVGAPIAIGTQGLLFAAYHFVPDGSGYTNFYFGALAIFGIGAGIAVERTGRLGAGMVAHFINNLMAVVVLGMS